MLNVVSQFRKFVKYKYTFLTILAGVFSFLSVGGSSGWSTPSLEKLASNESPIPLTSDQLSWVASIIGIGGPMASIPCSYLLNKIGRKPVILGSATCYLIGWITLIFSTEVIHLYIGRYFIGMGMGSTFCTIPLYMGEVVDAKIRGKVVTFVLMCNSIGVLITFTISAFVSFQILNIISIYASLLMFLTFLFVPETPYFLLRNDKKDEARKSLMKLKGYKNNTEVENDMRNIQKFLDESEKCNFLQSLKQLMEPRSMKSLIIITMLLVSQQISGSIPLFMYMGMIFDSVGLMISTTFATIITEVLSGISALTSSMLIDRFGRKTLFGISATTCIFFHLVLGTFFWLKSIGTIGDDYSLIVLIGVIVFRMGYELGLSSVPSVVMSEIIPFNVRGIVGAYFSFVQGITLMISVKLCQIITDNIGQQYFHWIYSSGLVISTLFILYYMPETKNKLFTEIQDDLDKKRSFKWTKKSSEIYTIDAYRVKEVA